MSEKATELIVGFCLGLIAGCALAGICVTLISARYEGIIQVFKNMLAEKETEKEAEKETRRLK